MLKIVAINAPWASRFQNVDDWFGKSLDFEFEIEHVSLPFIPMQRLPGKESLAVLDMDFVQRYKQNGPTLFVAPHNLVPRDKKGEIIENCTSAFGIYLPPLFSPTFRFAWWFTRLFWQKPVMQVFANEADGVYVSGKEIGKSFEIWTEHELCHWLYDVMRSANPDREDNTHKYFYEGRPEEARKEILTFFGGLEDELPTNADFVNKAPVEAPVKPESKIEAMAEAIKEYEGYFPPGPKYPKGSVSFRNNNPGNIKDRNGHFLSFTTYEEGFKYLCDYLTRAATGKHAAYSPDMSLYNITFDHRKTWAGTNKPGFFQVYAPDYDNNNSELYAKYVARRIGVTISTKLRELV